MLTTENQTVFITLFSNSLNGYNDLVTGSIGTQLYILEGYISLVKGGGEDTSAY